MKFLLPLLVASALSTVLCPPSGSQDGRDPRPPLSKSAKAAAKKMEKQMQGAWKLVDMELVAEDRKGFGDRQLEHVGYALVHDSYLSIEFHLRLVDKQKQDWGQSLVTGLHRFELDGLGDMETSTIIATSTRSDGSPVFEAPGTVRKYRVSLTNEHMSLTRDDGHRLEFDRLLDDRRRYDVFGRPVRDEDEDSKPDDVGDGGGARKRD